MKRSLLLGFLLLLSCSDGSGSSAPPHAEPEVPEGTSFVLAAPDGVWPDSRANAPSISADGRYMVYRTRASNLVADDTNGAEDAFVFDREQRTVERINVDNEGQVSKNRCHEAVISPDGRTVIFAVYAPEWAEGEANDSVFVRDLEAGRTRPLLTAGPSVTHAGGFSLSHDARYIALSARPDQPGRSHTIWWVDRDAGRAVEVLDPDGQPFGWALLPSISADGRYIAFEGLRPGSPDDRPISDIFVFDRTEGTTRRVGSTPGGGPPGGFSHHASLSADGRFVAYESDAEDLVPRDDNRSKDIFVTELATGRTILASDSRDGTVVSADAGYPSISGDGRFVAFESSSGRLVPGDRNKRSDVFVRDLEEGDLVRVSAVLDPSAKGGGSQPRISDDGRWLAFLSNAHELLENGSESPRRTQLPMLTSLPPSPPKPAIDGAPLGAWERGYLELEIEDRAEQQKRRYQFVRSESGELVIVAKAPEGGYGFQMLHVERKVLVLLTDRKGAVERAIRAIDDYTRIVGSLGNRDPRRLRSPHSWSRSALRSKKGDVLESEHETVTLTPNEDGTVHYRIEVRSSAEAEPHSIFRGRWSGSLASGGIPDEIPIRGAQLIAFGIEGDRLPESAKTWRRAETVGELRALLKDS